MRDFPGRLIVINGQSNLDNDLLLRAGFPDATQAIAAATQFLLKTKRLISGQSIIVTGRRGSFGDANLIVMTDARANPAQPFGFAIAESTAGKTRTIRRGSKKSGSNKSVSASQEDGSKARASKKSGARRKRVAAKASAKK